MTDINKQKFLTELGKLLTFMYEEDRQQVLSIYNQVFEQAEDEQAVLSALVSPTRQAVIIARSYNAKERKLQIYSQSRDEDGYNAASEQVPDFVRAIEDAVPFEFTLAPEPVSEDQLSLFDDNSEPQSADESEESYIIPEEETESDESSREDFQDETAQEEVPQSDVPQEEVPQNEVTLNEVPQDETSPEETEENAVTEGNAEESEEKVWDKEDSCTAEEKEEHLQEKKTEAFIREFEIKPTPVESSADGDALAGTESTVYYGETVSKPRIFLLILYIIFAVPITAAGIVLLLVPTILFLALAIAFISVGCVLLAATFSGFAVFADIMVMLGGALIFFSLGLLFLWIFIWFIGGAMAALVRGILELARKWCYKEVPAV